jgi:hypothetical protein
MYLLYVRTGNGGADSDFEIRDLGIVISTGASWTLLSSSSPYAPEGADGQFTSVEIKDSIDLYNAITTDVLEWSKNGTDVEVGTDYVADYMLIQDFSDDDLNLNTGRLTLPSGENLPVTGRSGEVFWDEDDEDLYVYGGITDNWIKIGPDSVGVIDHGSLTGLYDDDHPQYGHLAQNEIVSGLWTFAPLTSTDPSFNITPRGSAPTTNLTDGSVTIVGGLLYIYDGARGKWLSVLRNSFKAGRIGNATNTYLRGPNGIPSSLTGFRMARDGTIVSLFAQTADTETWTLEIRKNSSTISLLVITAATGNEDNTINVDFSQGDELKLFCNGSFIRAPVGGFEVAWRI